MSVGIRHDDLRRRNRALVIAAVRRDGRTSRTAIARATGLSHSTISSISSDLIGEGILVETRDTEGGEPRRGRPQVAIRLDGGSAAAMTVILLYNFLAVQIVDYSGRTIAAEQEKIATTELSAGALVERCIAMGQRLVSGLPERRILRIVVAIQGTTDAASRSLLWSPITPHEGLDFADRCEAAFGAPTTVQNDCNMIALALQWQDPQRYRDDFVAILLSNGIGMGLVLKNELFTGTHSSGGEFGHTVHRPEGALCRCGRRGCVEAYAGNYAIWRNAHRMPGDTPPVFDVSDSDMTALAERAREADGPEREAYRTAGEALGFGLGSLFALIDPAPVALVGMGAGAFDLIEPALREAIGKTAGGQHSTSITFATEPDELPLLRLGCAMRALTWIDDEVMATGQFSEADGRIVA